MLKLYHGITSVCSIKVRVGLAEIGLEYESVALNLQAGDQQNPDYLRLNPNGVVPTLVDQDLVLTESSLILEYIDREYYAGQLMPLDKALGASTRHWLLRCLGVHDAINTMTFATVMRDKIFATKTQDEIDASLAKMPNPVMRMKRQDLYAHGLGSDHVDQALVTLDRTFRDMTAALESHDWINGPTFGLADIGLLSYIDRLERLGLEGFWLDPYPHVAKWLAAMQARPSYKVEVLDKVPTETATGMRLDGAKYWPKVRDRMLAS